MSRGQTGKKWSAIGVAVCICLTALTVQADDVLDKAGAPDKSEPGFDKLTNNLTWGGYYEFEYEDARRQNGSDGEADFDQHRAILFFGVRPHDRIRMFAELEYEHGAAAADLKLEQAWLEFSINNYLNLRGGIDLIPVGRMNINHDGNLRDFVLRPVVDGRIIPTTWYEAGLSINGQVSDQIAYTAGISNGLREASGAGGLGGGGGIGGFSEIRNMRRTNALSENDNNNNKAVSGRVAFSPWLGTEFGVSGYNARYSATDPGQHSAGLPAPDSDITFLAFDWFIPWRAFEFKGEVVDVSKDPEPGGTLGAFGGYGELAWHFFPEFLRDSFLGRDFDDPKFTLLGRWENLDFETPGNDDLLDRSILSLGFNYRPIERMAFKVAYDWEDRKEAGALNVDKFSAGMVLGY